MRKKKQRNLNNTDYISYYGEELSDLNINLEFFKKHKCKGKTKISIQITVQ
jgi:hypothetical protein